MFKSVDGSTNHFNIFWMSAVLRHQSVIWRTVHNIPLTSADSLPFIEKIVEVARFLMVYTKYWPQRFNLPLSFMRLCLHWKGNYADSCKTQHLQEIGPEGALRAQGLKPLMLSFTDVQSINQISTMLIFLAKPRSVVWQPNWCSTAKSKKQFRNIEPSSVLVSMGERRSQRDVLKRF